MNLSAFPVDLQKKFEMDVVTGALSFGQLFGVSAFQNRYQADAKDAVLVLKSAYRKGLVSREQGETYTITGKSQSSVRSVFQHAAASGLSPKSVVRALKVVPADDAVAATLRVEIGQPVFCQTRIRLVNDEVVANQNNYIPIEVCPTLEEVDLSRRSFQVTLNEDFNTVITEIKEDYAIAAASGEDAAILGLDDGEEVLVVHRLSLSVTGLPLVWADIHVHKNRFHYVEKLWPQAALLLTQGG
jgi:GntR family transcriptional regulator, trehalose operon transcriptional repressor